MLALLGLIGIAVAGTAFVNLSSSDDSGSAAADDAFEDTDTEELADTNSDIFQFLDDTVDVPDPEIDLDPVIETVRNLISEGTDGDDILNGLAGNDYLEGSAGHDVLTGGEGADHIHGGSGNDSATGDDGDDLLSGGDGDDKLSGGYGDDTLIGGAGHDNIQGSDGDDIIDGVSGEDVAEKDYLNGSEGDDILIGNNGDVMSGRSGADRFEITDGAVSIMDYTGDDLLVLSYEGDAPVLTTEVTQDGMTLLANGEPVASLFGITSFDVTTVQLVAA
ncbi:calcium-binding protein [Octadecabacter sp.]|nr:calcium-binding protein [Octadecabacter sp.]